MDLFWLDRWLENFIRSRSLPPPCAGKDAFHALTQILTGSELCSVLESLRKEYSESHPHTVSAPDDFSFLDAALHDVSVESCPLR